MTVAPPILAGVPGTFAHSVFHDRHPVLIDQVIAAHPYGPAQRDALHRLLDESRDGLITELNTAAPDLPQWLAWGRGLWGRPWRAASFLWAESYFYRRLLEAVGYFGPGPWTGVDPFAPKKYAELDTPQVAAELAALADLSAAPGDTARDALLVSALWGNQADLGFRLTAGPGARTGLLVDDSAKLWAALDDSREQTVCLIADNAGRELLPDLVLADHLLTTGLAARITLYLKPQPYYVSDATPHDLRAVLRLLRTSADPEPQRIGQRLWQAIAEDRLIPRTHEFFCAPLTYHDLPDDLTAEIATATMTILKGDLNYRRLVGDNYWPPTTPFTTLTAYFPSPVTALRTLKCDVVTGLPDGRAAELDATDPSWRTSGDYAVVQCDTDRRW
ncbi:damage-control phosphatase ARMT1 family protein [Nocardia macrotermitis]|uniref:Damage-control phosphatase ARMT1-like metal-binding domain-containing protein n=1 Tax=Nocardia macrotermitis TaxID=2585198 RepID=A0A7K0D8F4_9NOCA|nr:damage-control phosphatase ARMT1 family protein [Nocardia macrotermitis]MQY21998.1 hypothetical protein [Nocardia macrotermitis]